MAAYVASFSATVHAASGNVTVTLPSGGAAAPAANDILYLLCVSGDNVTHTVSGFTNIYETNNGTTLKRSLWYKRAAGGDSNPTVTHTAGSTIGAQVIVVRGAVTSGTPHSATSESVNASSTSITHATITPNSSELVLMLSVSGNTDTSTGIVYSAPSGTNPSFNYNTALNNAFSDGTTETGLFMGWGASADGTATGSRTLTQDTARVNIGTFVSVIPDYTIQGPTVQAKGDDQSGTANITVPWPPHATNDIGLLLIESAGGEAANLTTPNGFAAVTNSPQATGSLTAGTQLTVYWCRATSNAMASPVVTDPGNHAYGVIITVRGCITSGNPWDITAGSVKAGATTTTTWDSVTTTQPNCLVLNVASRDTDSATAAWSVFAGGNTTTLGEWHDLGTTSGNGGGIVINVSRLAAPGGTGAPTCTVSSSINAMMTLAFPGQPAGKFVSELMTPGVSINQSIVRSGFY